MQDLDDLALLREYAANNSETAFEELVSRRAGFVYSSALRQVRDPHLAGEITQAVFIILARKAGKISDKTVLTGWLFKTTRFATLAQIRNRAKQSLRTAIIEKEFQMQNEIQSAAPGEIWNQMSPLLDEALAALGEKDRQALLLRFFENKTLAEVGNVLGMGEDTARKRVTRVLEKLRKYFSKRGVVSTTAIIAGAISANSVQAAPVALAKTATAVALANGAAASISTLILVKGAMKIMAWTKMQMAIVIGAAILATGAATTVVVKEISNPRITEAMWELSLKNLTNLPTVLVLRESKFTPHDSGSWKHYDGRYIGRYVAFHSVLQQAYGNFPRTRVRYTAAPPSSRYDLMLTLSEHPNTALAKAIEQQFGWTAHTEMVVTNVLRLQPSKAGFRNLEPRKGKGMGSSMQSDDTSLNLFNGEIMELESDLEAMLETPVVDGTGLADTYDLKLTWQTSSPDEAKNSSIKRALLEQFGLELVSTNMPIEMLVVEKVK